VHHARIVYVNANAIKPSRASLVISKAGTFSVNNNNKHAVRRGGARRETRIDFVIHYDSVCSIDPGGGGEGEERGRGGGEGRESDESLGSIPGETRSRDRRRRVRRDV